MYNIMTIIIIIVSMSWEHREKKGKQNLREIN